MRSLHVGLKMPHPVSLARYTLLSLGRSAKVREFTILYMSGDNALVKLRDGDNPVIALSSWKEGY
jgi:hypothetical protein